MYEFSLFLSVFCLIGVCFAFMRSRAFSLFHPLTFYLAFHGFVFVFRPILAWIEQFDLVYKVYQFTPSYSDKVTAILASNLGMLVFAATCWRAGNSAMVFKQDRTSLAERERLKVAFLWAAAMCIPLGVYSLLTAWNTAVDTGSAYSNMIRIAKTGKVYNEGMNGYLLEAQLMLGSCAAIFAWLFRFRFYSLLPLIAFTVYRAGTGVRGAFVTAFVSAALFYLYDRKRRLPSLVLLAIVPVMLLMFTAIGDDRGASIRRMLSDDKSSQIFGKNRSGERALEGMDFANLEYLEFVIYAVPQRSGTYGYFNNFAQIFTEPVPRALWPDKPIGAPFQRINFFDYGNPVGMTLSLPGEGWYSLGWAGVVIWCALCGWFLGALYRRFVQAQQSTIQVAIYIIFLPILIVAFRDGQLVTVLRQALFFLLPIGLWQLMARLLGVSPLPHAIPALIRQQGSRRRTTKEQLIGSSLPFAVLRRRQALLAERSDTE